MVATEWQLADDGEEKRARRYASWLRPAGVEFAGNEAEQAHHARVTRLSDAFSLRTPDRVPVRTNVGFYPAKWAGITTREAMYEPQKAGEAWLRFNRHFQPDAMVSPLFAALPGRAFETLDYRLYHWPGHGVPDNVGYQYNEAEYMLAEEYDHLIEDPTDFLLRVYLPRISGAYEGFSRLGSLYGMVEMPFATAHMRTWAAPELRVSFERLAEAGRQVDDWLREIVPHVRRIHADGFPPFFGGSSLAPFDFIGDSLRGTREIFLDVYREPERLLAACDRLAPLMVRWVVGQSTPDTSPGIFMPLHKGADGFMSQEQFDTFYWPSLKAVILGLIDEGFTPFLFAEGRYGSRLEAISDLPPGKTVWLFDQTDMGRAKETVGRVACIQGNVPLSLLHTGTPEEVMAYCEDLIDKAGQGGGFILDIGAVADSAREENVLAMIRTAKEYGVYR